MHHLSAQRQGRMSEGVKIQVKVQDGQQVAEMSPHHQKIRDAMKQTAMRGQFWPEWSAGKSWKENVGSLISFLMPYGTKNCFWNRLNMSVTNLSPPLSLR